MMSTKDIFSEVCLNETVSPSSHCSVFYYLILKKQFGNTVTTTLLMPENVYFNPFKISATLPDSELEQELLSLINSTDFFPLPPSSSFPKSALKATLSHIHVP